jgi:serine/threonine protein kinase
VYKAVDRTTGEIVAIKHIDLEDSSEELADIQAEISLLSTCHSPYITAYKTSFVKGVKLWIVMEFLGGGSAADMVRYTWGRHARSRQANYNSWRPALFVKRTSPSCAESFC